MSELITAYPLMRFVPALLLLSFVILAHLFLKRYGYFRVRCPNCKVFNAYKVAHEDTGLTYSKAVRRTRRNPDDNSIIGHVLDPTTKTVTFKRFRLTLNCTKCGHVWERIEEYREGTY